LSQGQRDRVSKSQALFRDNISYRAKRILNYCLRKKTLSRKKLLRKDNGGKGLLC